MKKSGWWVVVLSVGCGVVSAVAQEPAAGDNALLLKEALRNSVLIDGGRPFHLILEIAPAVTDAPHHREVPASVHGTMEIFWAAPDKYKLVLDTPSFKQMKIVEGSRVEEHDEGDFYPRWLDNFVQALLNPVPQGQMAKLMAQRMTGGGGIAAGSFHANQRAVAFTWPRCLETSERPGGITEETSEARICLDAAKPWYQSVTDFTRYVEFTEFKKFGDQMIPRTWSDDIPENLFVEGRVRKLEALSKEASDKIRVTAATPLSGQIKTMFLSRDNLGEDVERLPDFDWPREDTEALEGYMIVYVRTDRTGQVRESYWDSSDNYKLQDAGVKFALETKLRPLMFDGAAVQVEGPLVIHFKTHRSGEALAGK
jgi:hypothetical protein